MKLSLILTLTMLSTAAFAQEFNFVTPGKDKALSFKATATDVYAARSIAAEKCFDHFTQGQAVSDDFGTDVINICTNMRQK